MRRADLNYRIDHLAARLEALETTLPREIKSIKYRLEILETKQKPKPIVATKREGSSGRSAEYWEAQRHRNHSCGGTDALCKVDSSEVWEEGKAYQRLNASTSPLHVMKVFEDGSAAVWYLGGTLGLQAQVTKVSPKDRRPYFEVNDQGELKK